MSFFKKMVDKFEDLVGDDDDKKKGDKKKEETAEGTKDHSSHDQHASYGQQPQYEHSAPYGQQAYGAPPPMHQPSSGGPPLPPGWISQWDPNSQRYYYLEQATGRTQWDPPQPYHPTGFAPPSGPPMGAPGFGHENHGSQYGPSTGYYSQETKHVVNDPHTGGLKEVTEKKEKKEKKSDKGGMLAAGAGGLAVGAVGGAMIGHAMGDDSSDDEHHGQSYQQQPSYAQQTTYYQEPAPPGPPPLEPPPPGDNESVSSSDKEDLAEAREDYENASDASDREEAREDYEEAYEEAYD
ncbi:MAG: hypothetical protein Q9216_002620 [Gyalolechia sp. 2 TL-2023]